MHATSILFRTIALVLTVTALPSAQSLEPRQNGQVVCQTSDGSPYSDDVTGAINYLNGKSGTDCAQGNDRGSDCTTVATSGTAGIAVCGRNENWGCGLVATWANDIQNGGGCQANGKVGGIYFVDDSARVELVHT